MRTAFSYPNLEYIGNKRDANFLCRKKGISPQSIDWPYELPKRDTSKKGRVIAQLKGELDHGYLDRVCSIGFSEKEQKWYGWSHRAIYGFAPGSTCVKSSLHYNASSKEEWLKDLESYYKAGDRRLVSMQEEVHRGEKVIRVRYFYNGNPQHQSEIIESFPEEYGRGEWEAKTWEDAKQMAIDFARSVS
jgi:hypothetical protein